MKKPRCRELPTQASYALRSGRAQILAQAFGTTLRAGLPLVLKPPSLGQAKAHTARNRCGSLWVNVRKAYHVHLYRVCQEVFLGRSTRKCQTAVSPRERNRGRMRGVLSLPFMLKYLKISSGHPHSHPGTLVHNPGRTKRGLPMFIILSHGK